MKHRTRFDLAVALTAIALAWAGAGLAADGAQEEDETIPARTGEILDDCNNIRCGINTAGTEVNMTADCRTSDTTLSRTSRTYTLSDKITNNSGTLAWSTSHTSILTSCNQHGVEDANSVFRFASRCTTDGSAIGSGSTVTELRLNIGDRIGVNSSGEFYDK